MPRVIYNTTNQHVPPNIHQNIILYCNCILNHYLPTCTVQLISYLSIHITDTLINFTLLLILIYILNIKVFLLSNCVKDITWHASRRSPLHLTRHLLNKLCSECECGEFPSTHRVKKCRGITTITIYHTCYKFNTTDPTSFHTYIPRLPQFTRKISSYNRSHNKNDRIVITL